MDTNDKPIALHHFSSKQIADTLKQWILNDIDHDKNITKMKVIFQRHKLSGNVMFVLETDTAKHIVKDDLSAFMTHDAIQIMFECFDQYKKEDPDDLKLKSATEIGDMLLHFAIDKLLAHIRDNNVDGKAFIESLNDKHMIQDETGWSDDEVYQIESLLLKHQTLTESQFKENMDYVLKTKYDEHTLSTRIVDKIKEVILAFDVEALQWNIKTGQSVEEFSDTVMNMMEEVVETRTTSDDQKEYVEDTTIQVIYEAIADCFMFNESSLYRPQWTCSNCSNYNVNKVIGNCINTDLSVCSLCGIKERQSIVLMIRNQPTFLMVNQADSAAAYKTNTSYFMQIISVKVDRFQVKVTANDVASYRRNTVYIKDVAHRNEDAIVVEFNHEDPSVVVDVIVDVKRDGLYHLAIYDYKTATEPYTNSNQIQFQFEYPSVDEEYKPNSIDLSSVFQREGKHKAFEDTKLPALGDTVELRSGKIGTVRFIGPVHFAKGNWIGVELHNASGEHDGAVRGVRYFTCPPTRGIFVKKIKSIQSNAAPIGVYWSMPSKSFGDISYEVVFDDRYEGLTANDVDNILDEIETESKEPTLKSDKDAVTSQINFKIGDRVRLARGKTGLVKFIGETEFAKGEVIGLQLDSWTAAGHDGTVRDKKYFEATQGHGYFTRRSSIVAVLEQTFDDTEPETDDTLSKKNTAIAHAATLKANEFNDDAKEESVVTVTDKDEVDDGESPLIQACRRGDDATVKLLLKTPNIKINQKRKTDGATALFVACREGATQCVRHLLSNNLLFINESKTNGRSPLFIASFFGHHEIVDLLINHSHRMTKQRMNHGILDVNQCDSKGFTPLFVAAQNGHTKIVTLLLRNAADVNQSEQSGRTPLWISSLRGHVDVVRVLLDHSSIDIDYKDLSGVTPLWAACQNNNSEVVELLLHPRNVVVGGDDSQEKTTESRQGANPNLAKHDGCTPLWIAASRGNSQCIEPLINYGADLNKPDQSQGSTPLFIACQNGKKASVDLLLAANADVNRPRSGDGTTALMMAAHNGHAGIVDVLLKCDADSMQANTTGLNALASAAMQGHAEIVKLMYQHLLNVKNQQEIVDFVNAGDGVNGWTPLHLACMGGHETVIKYLINVVKVDIFKKDYENKTGLEHAWQNGHQAIVAWLSQLEQTWINNNSNAPADNATTTTLPTLDINVNDKVRLKDEKTGIVRWKGQFDGTSIDYYGIELDEPYSNANIGRYPSHNNHFDCAPNRGIFVQIGAIVETLAASSVPIAAATKVQVDDMVRVCHGGTGIVKYIGEIHNTNVIGIVMDDSHPSYGDGTVDGKRYLESEHGRGFFAYPREIKENLGSIQAPEPTQAERTPLIPKLDDHVRLDDGRDGVVQFVGITEFSNGETMVGLELNDWSPQSTNGTVNGKEYFDANPGRGYFVNTQSIAHILGDDDTDAKEKEKDKEEEPVDLKLRDRIVTTHGTGIVRFMGGVHFDEREMIGIELDRWSPNGHNGIIHGHKYFHSTDGHGWFIRNNSAQVLKNLTPTERRRESQTTTKDRTRRGSVIITNIPPTMKVGDRIILDTGARGQLVFIGNVAFCAHEKLLGIVLDEWSPNAHNGSIAGKPYFTAPDGQGLLVPISAVQEHIARERQEGKALQSEEEKESAQLQGILGLMGDVRLAMRKRFDALKIGDEVLFGAKKGRVKFLGTTEFSKDEPVLGIELDEWSANANDGTIQGKKYFDTSPGKGFFMRKQSYMNLADMINASDFASENPENEILRRDSVVIHDVSSILPIEYELGDKVRLENGDIGVIKFIGKTAFCQDKLIGVELDKWSPNGHNGKYKETPYFDAVDGRGFFVRHDLIISKINPDNPMPLSSLHDKNVGIRPPNTRIGDRIRLKNGLVGIIRFQGRVDFSDDVYVGMSLEKKHYNGNDGQAHGRRYFNTKKGRGYFAKKTEIARILTSSGAQSLRQMKNVKSLTEFPKLGDKVRTIKGKTGVVKYMGTTSFAKGVLIGLELDQWWPNGHDGSVKKARYFSCPTGRGYFTRLSHLVANLGSHPADHDSDVIKDYQDEKTSHSNAVEGDADLPGFKVGDRVKLQHGKTGVVRYIGTPGFSEEELVGIELDSWSANAGDGSVQGEKVFATTAGRGYFTRRKSVANIIQSTITEGAYARLKGLLRVPKFNGKTVKIVAYVEKKGRWKVKLLHAKQEKKYLGVREENLDPILDWEPISSEKQAKVLSLVEYPSIGERVKTRKGRYGIVKYVGPVDFSPSSKDTPHIGLELEQWDPNGHNGTVKDKKYFVTMDGRGYFVKLDNLVENLGRPKTDKEIKKEKAFEEANKPKAPLPAPPKVKQGDRVKLARGRTGTVKYIGPTEFSNGKEVIGLELDTYDAGASDKHKKYFDAPSGRGYFTRRASVANIILSTDLSGEDKYDKTTRRLISRTKKKLREIEVLAFKHGSGVVLHPNQIAKMNRKEELQAKLEQLKRDGLKPKKPVNPMGGGADAIREKVRILARKTSIDWTGKFAGNPIIDVALDDAVRIANGGTGVVRYIGPIAFLGEDENVIGVLMDQWHPNYGNGTIDAKKYFNCDDGRGYFAHPPEITENLGSTKPKKEIAPMAPAPMAPALGTVVKLKDGQKGVVKYVGPTEFSDGQAVVGVELAEWSANTGENTVNEKYFGAAPGRSYFARMQSISGWKVPTDLVEEAKRLDEDADSDDEDPIDSAQTKDGSEISVNIGDRIVTVRGYTGVVRFKGGVHFDEREAIGIELDQWSPNGHNGIIHGHKYFSCTEGRGYFIRLNAIEKNMGATRRRRKSRTQSMMDFGLITKNLKIGDHIKLSCGKTGVVKYLGTSSDINTNDNKSEDIVGIELDEWSANGNDGKNLFKASKGRGYFALRASIHSIITTLYDKHASIIATWNENTNEIKSLSNSIHNIEQHLQQHNDDEKETFSTSLFNTYSKTSTIIGQQSIRMSAISIGGQFSELIDRQNAISESVQQLDQSMIVVAKESDDTNRRYNELKQRRMALQHEIERKLKECDAMIENENRLENQVQKAHAKKKEMETKLETLHASSTTCASLIDQYNDFMSCNKHYIDEMNVKFDSLWNEFESKWMEWNAQDIVVWFKYKTIKMNTSDIPWDQVEEQLTNRNVSGKFLDNLNNLVFEWIGIKDFEIVTHLIKSIAGLKASDGTISKHRIPKEYLCPITKQIMQDPVMAFDGYCYDRVAIEEYLKIHKRSPTTGANTDCIIVFPNRNLEADIQRFIQHGIDPQSQEPLEGLEGVDETSATAYI
eukprot:106149_1